jgi:hypothetical protein
MKSLALAVCAAAVAMPVHAAVFNLEVLPTGITTTDSTISAGEGDFYEFSLPFDLNNSGRSLNIQTRSRGGEPVDTIIALYNDANKGVALDDDGQGVTGPDAFYSQLSFGDEDPGVAGTPMKAGTHGLLTSSTYLLLVLGLPSEEGLNAGLGVPTDDLLGLRFDPNSDAGDYTVQFALTPVPAALPLMAAAIAALGFMAHRRR